MSVAETKNDQKRKDDNGKSLSKNSEEFSPTAAVSSGIVSIPGKSATSQVLTSSIASASGSSIPGSVSEPLGRTLQNKTTKNGPGKPAEHQSIRKLTVLLVDGLQASPRGSNLGRT